MHLQNHHAIATMFVCSLVCVGQACIVIIHTVHFSMHLSLPLDTPMFWAPTTKYVHLPPTVFFHFHLEQRWGMDAQAQILINK